MQRVQTRTRLLAPLTTALTICRFGSKRRGRTLWACDTRRPTTGPLSQISHLIAIDGNSSVPGNREFYHDGEAQSFRHGTDAVAFTTAAADGGPFPSNGGPLPVQLPIWPAPSVIVATLYAPC